MKISHLAVLFLGALVSGVQSQGRAVLGQWSQTYTTPLVPVAAANLPDGRVVYWSAYDRFRFGGRRGFTATAIFDPSTGRSTETIVQNTDHDMFCPGTATLEDGRVMITGGSNAGAVTIYDPVTNKWTKEPQMGVSRGYHSMTVLHDGSVFTVGGSWSGGRGGKFGELWDPVRNLWLPLRGIRSDPLQTNDIEGVFRSDNHMWLFESPRRRIFHAGPSRQMHWLDVRGANGRGSITQSISRGNDKDAMNGNAVMYDVGRILTVGGAENYNSGSASNATHSINIRRAEATVEQVGDMNSPRAMSSSVVLPSGEVVVFGGQTSGKNQCQMLRFVMSPQPVVHQYLHSCNIYRQKLCSHNRNLESRYETVENCRFAQDPA